MTRRAAIIAMGAMAVACMTGCSKNRPSIIRENVYMSPYDWNGLVRNGERLEYSENGVLLSHWGIDVSEHQKTIDWSQVQLAGVQFAFIRIGNRGSTAGALKVDKEFLANCRGAQQAKIPTSGYFFSQAITADEAREEAEFALEQMHIAEAAGAKFQAIAYDHEAVNIDGARANNLSGEQLSENAAAFCEAITAAGYEPLLYGNQRDLKKLSRQVRDAFPVWLAEYDTEIPTAPLDFTIWQYTNAGNIPGIPTQVDLNIWLPTKRGAEIVLLENTYV
ncbi:GH25 family lysozyme [Adlercreutzia sp. ZJ304]|uniref:GH25 family lysozyme n=1 Tax=Adlercreutzia sp. ZJ304 TaxID=2709791 RepID=UPI001F149AB9|nr:GH25 family lysozyme [Adlercreutzia sp. ZJ304]